MVFDQTEDDAVAWYDERADDFADLVVSPCKPRPRAVPEVGSPPVEPENPLPAPVVAAQRLVVGPLGHKWMRGIAYDALRRELADGYYPDDTL